MKKLELEPTKTTAEVSLDGDKGTLKFSGRSIPEDPDSFFNRIIEWMEEHFKTSNKGVTAEFMLEYVNSGSSKYFLEIIRRIDEYHARGNASKIIWLYEEDDESIQELGELYESTVQLPFEIKDVIM